MNYSIFLKLLLIVFFISGCESETSSKSTTTTKADTNTTTVSFSIVAITDANVSTEYSSGDITINGISGSVAIALSSGTLIVNNTDLNTTTTTISSDDNISIKLTSSSSYSTAATSVLTIDGVSKTFSITTKTNLPSSFSFTPITNVNLSTSYNSNDINISGLDNNTTVTATLSGAGVLIKNGAILTTQTTTVQNTDNLLIRLQSSSNYSMTVSSTLSIASLSAVYKITTMAQPTASIEEVSQYSDTDVDFVSDVVLNAKSSKAYLANSSGILIVDINSSSSSYMTTLDSFDINNSSTSTIRKVTITADDTRLFVAAGYDGIIEFNVSNSSSITQLVTYNTDYNTSSKFAWSLALSSDEDVAFVATCAGIDVFDIGTKGTINRLDELNISGGNCNGVWLDLYKYDIVHDGKYIAYLAYGNQGVKTINIITPQNIELNATYTDSTCTDARSIDISTDGNRYFVACGTGGVHIVDVTDPTTPTKISTYPMTSSDMRADHVRLNGNYLYVAYEGGLDIVDISTITSPTLLVQYFSSGAGTSSASDNNASYFYLGHGTNGLLKLRLDN